jgi:hypothetical protein
MRRLFNKVKFCNISSRLKGYKLCVNRVTLIKTINKEKCRDTRRRVDKESKGVRWE